MIGLGLNHQPSRHLIVVILNNDDFDENNIYVQFTLVFHWITNQCKTNAKYQLLFCGR